MMNKAFGSRCFLYQSVYLIHFCHSDGITATRPSWDMITEERDHGEEEQSKKNETGFDASLASVQTRDVLLYCS